MKFSTLERKARSVIKTRPEFRQLEKRKTRVAKGLASGKLLQPQATALRKLICLRRRRLVNRELYSLLCADAVV